MIKKNLKLQYVKRDSLTPSSSNSRTHSDAQIDQIAASIKRFGWTNPVLIDEENSVIAGHGRLMAAVKLGIDAVPCITIPGLSENERRLLLIADNKIQLNAGWDTETLKLELADLDQIGEDIALTGFDLDDLESFFAEDKESAGKKEPDEENHVDQFAVVVVCADPDHQDETFNALKEQGFNVKKASA